MIFEGWEVGSGWSQGGTKVVVLGGGTGGIDRGLSIDRSRRSGGIANTMSPFIYRLAAGRQRRDRGNTDPGFHGRIEESGFHNWFGFYDNSFRQIRIVMPSLDRAPGSPLATWQEAFIPGYESVFIDESFNGRTSERPARAPPNDQTPWRGAAVFSRCGSTRDVRWRRWDDHFHAPAPAGYSAARRGTVRAPARARFHLTIAQPPGAD